MPKRKMTWSPASRAEVEALLRDEVAYGNCAELSDLLVTPHQCLIERDGAMEPVFVVAHGPGGVVYFDDVDDDFATAVLQDDKLVGGGLYGPLRPALIAISGSAAK